MYKLHREGIFYLLWSLISYSVIFCFDFSSFTMETKVIPISTENQLEVLDKVWSVGKSGCWSHTPRMQMGCAAALRGKEDSLVCVLTSLLCNEGICDVLLELVQHNKHLMNLQEAADDLETEQELLISVFCQTDFTIFDGNAIYQLFYFLFKEKHSRIINE